MEIFHRFAIGAHFSEQFRAVGVDLPESKDLILVFEIAEDDPRWRDVERLAKDIGNGGAGHTLTTKFSRSELDAAAYLSMLPSWHHGYPQPEDEFAYRKATYDLSDYCPVCGIGARQVAPFCFKKPPSWGRRSILQLNWVFDEYFVKPEIWESVFRPYGAECRPVVLDKTGAEIESVVQLEIPNLVELQMGDYPFEECSTCGRKKFDPRVAGFSQLPASTASNIFKSTQYFGSGASAFRHVLVSNALYGKFHLVQARGVEFQPCGPVTLVGGMVVAVAPAISAASQRTNN